MKPKAPAGSDVKLRQFALNKRLDDVLSLVSTYDISDIIESADSDGRPALYFASRGDHVGLVNILLDHNVNVNAIRDDGSSVLNIASVNGRMDVAKILLDRGANVNAARNNGETPLGAAKRNNRSTAVALFTAKGGK